MAEGTTGPARDRLGRIALGAGAAGLLVGIVIGASAGGSSTKTITDVQHDVTTQTTTVPVEHVRTVTKVRRVVKTVTVHAQPVDTGSGGGGGGSGSGSSGASDGSQYAGMTCAEIGHSFTVTPGSDPEHDRDGDGIACEAYP
jgi:Excalibur calcium-binding domain